MSHSPPETRIPGRGLTRFTPDADPRGAIPGVHLVGVDEGGAAQSIRVLRRIGLTLLMSVCGASAPDAGRSGELVSRGSPDAERAYSFSAVPACTTFVLQRSNQLRR